MPYIRDEKSFYRSEIEYQFFGAVSNSVSEITYFVLKLVKGFRNEQHTEIGIQLVRTFPPVPYIFYLLLD